MATKLPTLEEMMEAGVHFGHRTRQWNPKMSEYIYGKLEGIHIINLEKTQEKLQQAVDLLSESLDKDATIVFVGTKRQAAPVVKAVAEDAGVFYITERWPGGLVTNFKTIQSAVKKYEELLEKINDKAYMESVSTKQKYILLKEAERQGKIFKGLQGLEKKPDVLVVIDPRREKTAIAEARKANLPIISIVDTNTDPDMVTHPIPANDDALRSIELILNTLGDSIKSKPKGK
ncbi:30S ribosomal protein S2 [candidate division WWE3 bacterium]|uniref:Small ribosomal subunit protein uS2 n=1 Tax=candidate division WWE3 bacterium TaxID=2053526 RepID=A0A955LKL0_UNCKA|nr:30S ribosomal protein S2 [candidate division WWE3 bacterium]